VRYRPVAHNGVLPDARKPPQKRSSKQTDQLEPQFGVRSRKIQDFEPDPPKGKGTVVLMASENVAVERIAVWQCIGCGKIEGPRPCIGICQDRKAEFVYAFEYDDVIAQVGRIRGQAEVLEALVRRLACTTPRDGEWERSYHALQNQARRALAALTADMQ
jgi:hypothetical protein